MSIVDPTAPLRGLVYTAIVGALLFATGYAWRWSGDSDRMAAAQQEVIDDYQARKGKAEVAGKTTIIEKERVREVVRKGKNTVEWLTATRVEYLHVCLPDDGLRLWRAAAEGRHVDLQPTGVDRAGTEGPPPTP